MVTLTKENIEDLLSLDPESFKLLICIAALSDDDGLKMSYRELSRTVCMSFQTFRTCVSFLKKQGKLTQKLTQKSTQLCACISTTCKKNVTKTNTETNTVLVLPKKATPIDFWGELKVKYPNCNIELERAKMQAWIGSHPGRTLNKMFAINWLKRASENAIPMFDPKARFQQLEIEYGKVGQQVVEKHGLKMTIETERGKQIREEQKKLGV